MSTDDDKLRVLSIVWDHWMKDDILARKILWTQKRIDTITSFIMDRLIIQNMFLYIDLYDAGVVSINGILLTAHIRNAAHDLWAREIPLYSCPECKKHVVRVWDTDQCITLLCMSRHCQYTDIIAAF